MSLRRVGTLVIAFALTACTSVTQEPQPADLVFAAFASPNIPTPNDLALASLVTKDIPGRCGIATDVCGAPPDAQTELLCAFRAAGGFPSDQEVDITIPITAKRWDPAVAPFGAYVDQAAPAVDLATVTAATVSVFRVDTTEPTALVMGTDLEAVSVPGDCSVTPCKPGALLLKKKADPATGSRRWPAGARIAYAIRGGANGVKAVGGVPLSADSAIAFTIPNKDLTVGEYQPLGRIPDTSKAGSCGFGSNQDEVTLLNTVRSVLWNPLPWCYMAPGPLTGAGGWNPVQSPQAAALCAKPPAPASASAYGVTSFPVTEAASVGAFSVAAAPTVVLADSGSGAMPLPSDFLLAANGKVRDIPTFCSGVFDPGTQSCSLSRAMATLDGFSTTAPVTFNTTAPVKAGALPANSVFLFDLGPVGAPLALPVLLTDAVTATSGAQILAASYAGVVAGTTVALAPAIAFPPAPAGTIAYLPPLKDNRQYALVVTDKLLAEGDVPFQRNTMAKLLWGFSNKLFDAGKSKIPGVADADAAGLQRLRDSLDPLLTQVLPLFTGGAITKSNVVMAYTIKTQPVVAPAQQVLAFAAGAHPVSASILTPAQVGGLYGVDATAAFPGGIVKEFAEVSFDTQSLLLSGLTGGAFDPAHPTAERLTALVALPDPALVTGACPAAFPAGAKCAPLVVFRHGLPRAKGDMLPIATRLAAQGFVVAAIDAEKFGDRTYCGGASQAAADQQCFAPPTNTPAATCVDDPKLHGPGDPLVVGRCSNGQLLRKRIDCADADVFVGGSFNPACFAPKGVPLATGQFLITTNFFRARDTFRQDVIDQAALVNALAPAAPPTAGADAFYDHLAASNLAINPDEVYFASLSFGSTNAALSVAVNPRFKKGAFESGFATITDAFFNPESKYYATAVGLLHGLGVEPGTAAFTQYQAVVKWILDPADPANFGATIKASGKPVLHQIGLCDGTVPNAQSRYFTAALGLPVPTPALGDASTGYTQWFTNSASSVACPAATVDHGWLITPSTGSLMTQAQDAFATFLATGAAQPTLVVPLP